MIDYLYQTNNSCPPTKQSLIIDREAREIMYLVASVHLSVSLSMAEPFDLWPWFIRGSALLSAAKNSHYQSKVFVCVSNNRADVVDRLLILGGDCLSPTSTCATGMAVCLLAPYEFIGLSMQNIQISVVHGPVNRQITTAGTFYRREPVLKAEVT